MIELTLYDTKDMQPKIQNKLKLIHIYYILHRLRKIYLTWKKWTKSSIIGFI